MGCPIKKWPPTNKFDGGLVGQDKLEKIPKTRHKHPALKISNKQNTGRAQNNTEFDVSSTALYFDKSNVIHRFKKLKCLFFRRFPHKSGDILNNKRYNRRLKE
jgi:hypothetical protein